MRAVWVYIHSLISRVRPAHPSSKADLSSKIHRKVVTRRLGVYPFPHQSSAPGTLLRRKRIYPRKSIAKLCVLFGWFPPECAQQVFCCTTRLPQPSRAWVVLSVMDVTPPHSDGCDASPTETLRNLHLTGSRYLLQLADGSLDI